MSKELSHVYKAGQFEGPIDLLWQLIHDNKINIYDIPIVDITNQYLDYLDSISSTDLEDLSEFYRWAAKLIYMKSRMLLPVESSYDDDDLDDPRDELVEKLIEYQKYKKLAFLMEEREDEEEWSFERKKIERQVPLDTKKDSWEKVDTSKLLQNMQKMFKSLVASYSDSKILNMYEEVSVNEKVTLIAELLNKQGECMFSQLITRKGNLLDIVCAFLAILESVKFKMIVIYQSKLFCDIKIRPAIVNG
ncbi:MAG: segregation/condensation protein A [Treponema sp.]|nr:segregation/condensation protein A [Treponema sp.]